MMDIVALADKFLTVIVGLVGVFVGAWVTHRYNIKRDRIHEFVDVKDGLLSRMVQMLIDLDILHINYDENLRDSIHEQHKAFRIYYLTKTYLIDVEVELEEFYDRSGRALIALTDNARGYYSSYRDSDPFGEAKGIIDKELPQIFNDIKVELLKIQKRI